MWLIYGQCLARGADRDVWVWGAADTHDVAQSYANRLNAERKEYAFWVGFVHRVV